MRDNGGTKHMMLLGAVIGFIIHDVAVLSVMSLPVEGRCILSEGQWPVSYVRKGHLIALVVKEV